MCNRFIRSISDCDLIQKLFKWLSYLLLFTWAHIIIYCAEIKLPQPTSKLHYLCVCTPVCYGTAYTISRHPYEIHFQCPVTKLLVYAISLPSREPKSPTEPVVSECSQRMGICWAICTIMSALHRRRLPYQVEGISHRHTLSRHVHHSLDIVVLL